MNPHELARATIKAFEQSGMEGTLTLVMPGRWGKRNTKRLCLGGPVGRIVSDAPAGGIIVSFGVMDLSAFLTAKGYINATIVQKDGVPGGTMFFRTKEQP